MRPPAFWSPDAEGRDRAPTLQLLARPLSWLYSAAGAWALAQAKPVRAGLAVICIGNVSVGGVGKTPVARAARARLQALGAAAATLSRGYGGRERGPLLVDPARHDAAAVGDEPLLHARDGPAFVARDRVQGAALAERHAIRALVLDDGFQNHGLVKDLSILVFDAAVGLANGRVLPAGPLREPIGRALARADAAIVMRAEAGGGPRPAFLDGLAGPTLDAWLAPLEAPPAGPLVAFAGLGRPEKFFQGLAAAGAELREAVPFPDHHPYGAADQEFLDGLARRHGARLVTTEKDWVRLPAGMRDAVSTFRVEARFADPAAFDALLARALTVTARGSPAP